MERLPDARSRHEIPFITRPVHVQEARIDGVG
jgi:hypothetical protein